MPVLTLLTAYLVGISHRPTGVGYVLQTDPKINITIPATTVTKALQALGEASHIGLAASVQTGSDVITMKLSDVPLSEVMRKVADTLDATWRQEGDTYRLVRTADQQRAEKNEEFQDQVNKIKKSLKKRADELTKSPNWNPALAEQLATKVKALIKTFNPRQMNSSFYQQASQLSQQAPIGRAVTKIVMMMPPEDLASIEPGYRVVWSTNPTATQRPMPNGVSQIVEDFISAQATWQDAVSKYNVTAPTFNGATYWVGDFGDFQGNQNSGKIEVILLSAQKWSRESGLNLELNAYDAKGKRVAQGQVTLGNAYEDQAEILEMTKEAKPLPGEPLVNLPTEASEILKYRMRQGRPGSKAADELPSALVQKLLHPEKTDPLAILITPELFQVADIKKVNLIASLPDTSFFGPMSMMMQKNTSVPVDTLLKRLKYFSTQFEIKDGWMVIKPLAPLDSRESRVDRKELGQYLRRIATGQPLTIDESAAFALILPEQDHNYLPSQLASMFETSSHQYLDQNALKFYGLTTAEQRRAMAERGVPFESLNEKQLEIVNKLVYGNNNQLQYAPQEQNGYDPESFDLFYNGLMHEATESLPNGIPPKGLCKLQIDSSNVIKTGEISTPNYTMPGRTYDANTLAWQKYGQEHPEFFPWMNDENQKIDFGSLQFGKRTLIIFTFQFTKALSTSLSLEDSSTANFRKVTLSDLPDDFKKQFDQAYSDYQKSYANAKPGQFNGNQKGQGPPPL